MKPLLPLFALCILVGLIGCTTQTKTPADKKSQSKNSTPPDADKKEEKSQAKTSTPESDKKPIDLKVVKFSEFQDAIKEQKGKIVVIDFWATWCPPCKKAFPQHVDLHHKFHDKNVVCMSVSLDKVEDKEDARKFLEKQKATFPNYLPGDDPEEWQKHWNIKAIPATMVYDAGGKLHKFLNDDDKSFTSDDVEKLVEKLVKK